MADWYVGSVQYAAVTQWAAGTVYSVGDLRRQLATPAVGSERVFRCTTAGTSGGAEPSWTLTKGGTTNDNTVVWTEVTGNSTYNWSAPHVRLANAASWMAAGDRCWVSEDHAYTVAAAMTITFPGTSSAIDYVICVDHTGSVPPVSADFRTTATENTTGSNAIAVNGSIYLEGVSFSRGSGSSANQSIGFGTTGATTTQTHKNCAHGMDSTGSTAKIVYGTQSAASLFIIINTTFRFAAVGQQLQISSACIWRNTSSAILGTVPTALFLPAIGGSLFCQGVDLSALGSGKSLVDVSGTGNGAIYLENCKLGASVSVTSGSIVTHGSPHVHLVNCDSADTNYRYYFQHYQGTTTHETTIVRTGGASDGTTTFSRKMVSTANASLNHPHDSDEIIIWNETLSAITATIEIVTDNVTLTDAEAWISVEYLGTTGFPLSLIADDRVADVLATPANQTSSSVTWTTTGLATPVKQKLSVTFTPAEKGPIKIRVNLARPSTTMYYCPKVDLT